MKTLSLKKQLKAINRILNDTSRWDIDNIGLCFCFIRAAGLNDSYLHLGEYKGYNANLAANVMYNLCPTLYVTMLVEGCDDFCSNITELPPYFLRDSVRDPNNPSSRRRKVLSQTRNILEHLIDYKKDTKKAIKNINSNNFIGHA